MIYLEIIYQYKGYSPNSDRISVESQYPPGFAEQRPLFNGFINAGFPKTIARLLALNHTQHLHPTINHDHSQKPTRHPQRHHPN